MQVFVFNLKHLRMQWLVMISSPPLSQESNIMILLGVLGALLFFSCQYIMTIKASDLWRNTGQMETNNRN
jgi:hypothetical protein